MTTNTTTRQSSGNEAGNMGDKAASTMDQVQNVAGSAAKQVRQQASGLLSGQLASGTALVRNIAGAANQAADVLEKSNPQFAGMIRNAAGAADQFSHQIEDTNLEELVNLTTDFARRQPALFVGGAFAAGFLLARFAKSSAGTQS